IGLICTTSKSEAVTWPRLCRSELSQRLSGAPLKNIELPLSAMIMPYFFRAFKMTCRFGEKGVTSKFDFRRKRMPMGAAREFEEFAAQCDAGGIMAALLCCRVKRRACWIFPAATSSWRINPGKIGSPAASADVQVHGRCWLACRSQTAEEAASQAPLLLAEAP